MLRRDRWIPFRADMTWEHDWGWELRLAEKNAVYYDTEPLACYRMHDGTGTGENLNAAKNGAQERLASAARLTTERRLLEGRGRVARYNLRYALGAVSRWLVGLLHGRF